MLTIASYWWSPDPGSKFAAPYTPDDVRRLQRMVAKNLTVPHEFACITDKVDEFEYDHDIRAIQIDRTTHVPGTCYVRLMTFHPKGREMIGDKVLQIDLDTIIVGNMDHLVTREEDLVLWRNPARVPWNGSLGRAGQGRGQGRPLYNTSLLLHRCGTILGIWECFDPNKPPAKDDQWYLSDALGEDVPYFDGERDGVYRVAPASNDTRGGISGALPANACVVTFPGSHGKWTLPNIREANPWIEEYLR